MIAVFVAINGYIGWHGGLLLSYVWPAYNPAWYWIVFVIVAFSYLLGRLPLLHGPLGRLLKVIGSYYFAVLEFGLILLVFADIAALPLWAIGYPASTFVPVLGVVVLVCLAILIARGSWNAWNPIVRTYRFRVDKPAGGRKQLRVGMASDIHLGNIVGNRHLSRLVARVEAMQPDLILLPGDVIDDVIEPFIRNRMSEVMKRLKAPLGVYAVLGNHEYYGGHIDEYVRQMEAIGIRVLRDETVELDGSLYVAGRKDKAAEAMDPEGRKSVSALLSGLDMNRPIILMDHQPYQFDKALAAGADVMLSGHTHRGQFAPNHWITGRLFELDWGYLLKDKLHVIVSSGFGTWGPPVRIASRSEIVELVIDFQA